MNQPPLKKEVKLEFEESYSEDSEESENNEQIEESEMYAVYGSKKK